LDYILNRITVGDLLGLLDSIEKRKKGEALLLLTIQHNPYREDPNALFKALEGDSYREVDTKLDREGLEDLKGKLSKKSKFIKVKQCN
jgi:hypothetical protein